MRERAQYTVLLLCCCCSKPSTIGTKCHLDRRRLIYTATLCSTHYSLSSQTCLFVTRGAISWLFQKKPRYTPVEIYNWWRMVVVVAHRQRYVTRIASKNAYVCRSRRLDQSGAENVISICRTDQSNRRAGGTEIDKTIMK